MRRHWILVVLLLATGACSLHATDVADTGRACDLQPVTITPTPSGEETVGKFTLGTRTVVLHGPDSPEHPTAWEGPLEIESPTSHETCRFAASLVTHAYVSSRPEAIALVSYSGSQAYVDLLGADCKRLVPQLTSPGGKVAVSGTKITVPADCQCTATAEPCTCTSASVQLLGAQCRAELSPEESASATREQLGVAFVGTRKVKNPGKSGAVLVEQ